MIEWDYQGVDKKGKTVSGKIRAESEKNARKNLRSKGIRARSVSKPSIFQADLGEIMIAHGIAKPFTKSDLLNFTRQFGVMLDAGVPILQCLDILAKSQRNISFKKIIKEISEDVGSGKNLSDSLDGHPGFDILYINLIRAGEKGGVLSGIMAKLVLFMESQDKTRKAIKSAMMYPSMIVLAGIGVVYALMVFVIPKFTEVVKSSGQKVPWITQLVIDISSFIGDYAILIFITGFITIVFLSKYSKSKQGKPICDRFIMGLPIFGNIVIKGNLSSLTRTLSTMLNSGVPLIDSLDICISTIDNSVIAKDISMVKNSVTQGDTITTPLLRIRYFPEMVVQMVKIGEETGSINDMLSKVSDIFENEVQEAVGGMTKMIEPLVIIFLGGTVGTLLIAMYLPIFLSAGAGD